MTFQMNMHRDDQRNSGPDKKQRERSNLFGLQQVEKLKHFRQSAVG